MFTAILTALALTAPPTVDTLAPHAAGIALAEVTGVEEYDARPMDGNKGVRFKLKKVRGTGSFGDTVGVVTEFGGLRPPGSVPKPSVPLKPDSLKKGGRYWIAFSSRHDPAHNQGVIGFWPEKDAAAGVLDAAVKGDVLRWQPRYVPDLKLSYGHVVEKDGWRVRGERDGKVLWEKALPGKPLDDYHFGLFQGTGGTFEVAMPECGHILLTESDARLEKGNEFGLPEGRYYVNNGLDPVSGRRHATWVRVAQGPGVEVMNRAYDLGTGKPTRDERFDRPRAGGKAAGAKTEEWWRKVERTYDAAGRVTREDVFWYDESAEPEKRWVKVKS